MTATVASLGTSYPSAHCCASWASQLGRTIDCFPPMGAYIEPSSTMIASSQGEGFLVTSNSDPLNPVSHLF